LRPGLTAKDTERDRRDAASRLLRSGGGLGRRGCGEDSGYRRFRVLNHARMRTFHVRDMRFRALRHHHLQGRPTDVVRVAYDVSRRDRLPTCGGRCFSERRAGDRALLRPRSFCKSCFQNRTINGRFSKAPMAVSEAAVSWASFANLASAANASSPESKITTRVS
jgi:hypothetical protein